jgi:hypothetical protein
VLTCRADHLLATSSPDSHAVRQCEADIRIAAQLAIMCISRTMLSLPGLPESARVEALIWCARPRPPCLCVVCELIVPIW